MPLSENGIWTAATISALADALKAVPSEEVTLELTNGLSPIVLTPADEKYDYSYMVLPVRIKNG